MLLITEQNRKWWILVATGIMITIINIDATIMNLALATVAQAFHLSVNVAGWVINSYILCSALTLIPSGRIADLSSRRNVFLCGVALFLVGSVLCACAINITMLLIGRAIQGIGFGSSMALTTILATQAFPEQEKGRALGALSLLTGLGLAIGPSLGGVILRFCGWPGIFWLNVPLCLASIGLTLVACPKDRSTLHDQALPKASLIKLIGSLLFNNNYRIIVLVRFMYMVAFSIFLFIIPLYLQNALAISSLHTGFILLVMTGCFAITANLIGKPIDRLGYAHIQKLAFLSATFSFVLLTGFVWLHLFSVLYLGLVLLGLATGMYFPSSVRGVLYHTPSRDHGVSMSVFFSWAFLGATFGVSFAGYLLHVLGQIFLNSILFKCAYQATPSQYDFLFHVISGVQKPSAMALTPFLLHGLQQSTIIILLATTVMLAGAWLLARCCK